MLESQYHLKKFQFYLHIIGKQHQREHEGYVQIKKFWQDHTKAIRQFHRYPHRNKILGRESTEDEIEFLNRPNSSW